MEDYLSLNQADISWLGGGQTGDADLPPWTIWEKLHGQGSGIDAYTRATRDICTVSSVSDFWKFWLCIPQPSELLDGGRLMRDESGRSPLPIDSLMFFRTGIRPEWEDPANATGGHFMFSFKSGFNPMLLDEHWNNIVLAALGGTLEPANMVTGVRLVDKMNSGKQGCVRIEVWFRNFADLHSVDLLRTSVEGCMARRLDGTMGIVPRSDTKSHSD
jgi:translation initiation factor 4E